MRLSMILGVALVLLISSISALADTGSVVVDIVGSDTDNTNVIVSGKEKVELEIVGSDANNTTITSQAAKSERCHKHLFTNLRSDCNKECTPVRETKTYPWDDMHLGVDAWYGTFWYTDINMPKWPTI